MPENETSSIIWHYLDLPYGGHTSGDKTVAKILQAGFNWPTIFKDDIIMSRLPTIVKDLIICQGGMKWPLAAFLRSGSLMFRVWISWDISYPLEATNISWSLWIICVNGWKPLPALLMTPEWLLGFSKRLSSPISEVPTSSLVVMVPTSLRRNFKPY